MPERKKLNIRQKYFKENISLNGKWRTREERVSFFLSVPRLSVAPVLPLLLPASAFFSLVENMERSLSCDKAVACETGKRDPSRRGVGLACQSAPRWAVTRTCFVHASLTEPLLHQNNVGLAARLQSPEALWQIP